MTRSLGANHPMSLSAVDANGLRAMLLHEA